MSLRDARKLIDSLEPEEVAQLLGGRRRLVDVAVAIVRELNEMDGASPCWPYDGGSARCGEPGQHYSSMWSVSQESGHSIARFYGTTVLDGIGYHLTKEAQLRVAGDTPRAT